MDCGGERSYVRELGLEVHQLACSEEYEARRRRWRAVNGLRKADRPPVLCRPVGCWPELLGDEDLRCQDPMLRGVERGLRMVLIKHEMGDDSLVDPWWTVWAAVECEGEHLWGVEVKHHRPDAAGGAWGYDPPIKEEADLDRLVMPRFRHNEEETRRRREEAEWLFDGVMPVKVVAGAPLGATLCTYAADLLGLDGMMLYMATRPRMVHRLMALLRDAVMGAMDVAEATRLLAENNTGEMTCSDGLKTSPADQPVSLRDMWGFANSQEFDQVSPAMWQEFLLKYQKPILARFGLTQYGCCENLTRKIDGVLSIPNLRAFVCSAWTDLAKVVEAVGDRYTIMWREKATRLVFEDLDAIRRKLEEDMRTTQGLHRQIVAREIQTVDGRPQRLKEWVQIAKEAGARFN